MSTDKKNIGLIPAAGYANRISPLPCSKEIYPISYKSNEIGESKIPKVISASLLEKFRASGLKNLYMIIRKEKWDIPKYLGTGSNFGLNIAYIVTDPTPGTPHTIDKAFQFVKDKRVLFGFPDIQIAHKNPFLELLRKQENSNADIVLGLFKTDKPQKFDIVETGKNSVVKDIIIKPDSSKLKYTWLLAIWKATFTEFLHNFLLQNQSPENSKKYEELYVGNVFKEAIKNGMKVSSVKFPKSTFIDIGTIEDLRRAIHVNL